MYQVIIRPVKINDKIYQVGQKIKEEGKEAAVLYKSGYLKRVKENKDGKKTN